MKNDKTLVKVRDGYAAEGEKVWWRCQDGPERVTLAGSHLSNAKEYPYAYQRNPPRVKVIYED